MSHTYLCLPSYGCYSFTDPGSEVRREFSQPLHVAFVDLKAAFDSVDRLALWKALR